ncbi:DsbA family protein [Nocardia sp. CDC159]|uniref:DsbA family protein n=1 Tax=Nocardia pulmonis TaxID=2951408 RepID=A0A9X2EF30_9NOCA|nr:MULTISPECIES: thioredoxin domain-containing protein [Nocardia]MCM6777058.1 DsbA family protein [Nocardia pulmonis]MCM6789943.1 DsbA family protein [Nocardia sp. CDC159]
MKVNAVQSHRSGRVVASAAHSDRGPTLGAVLTALALIVLVAAVGIFVTGTKRDRDRAEQARAAAEAPPPVYTDHGTLRFGDPAATTVFTVTTDFACPSCRTFAQTSDATLAEFAKGRQVAIEYDPVAIVDAKDGYSLRAANAAACVAASAKTAWPTWYGLMFDRQPAKDATLTDDQLVDLATQAGASAPEVGSCIRGQRYQQFVTAHTNSLIAAGLTHTPSVRIGDRVVENLTPDGLRAAADHATTK